MLTVVALATPMELFFSEVWLIYEYQRDFMPLFVPAGHYFLFDLGRRMAGTQIREDYGQELPFSRSSLWSPTEYTHGRRYIRPGAANAACSWFYSMGASTPTLRSSWLGRPWPWNSGEPHLGNWTWAPEVPWTRSYCMEPPASRRGLLLLW